MGQLAVFLMRALDLPAVPGDRFIDDDGSVAGDDPVTRSGQDHPGLPPTNDRFCPNSPVTRGQMAAFYNRALG
ncbi:MAG: hypothetical protein ACR2NG_08435 [Acidimicrobiia bacterium]